MTVRHGAWRQWWSQLPPILSGVLWAGAATATPLAAGQDVKTAWICGISAALTHWLFSGKRHPAPQATSRSIATVNKAVFDSVADGIIGMDCGGRITFINPAGETLSGWTERDLIGHPVARFFDMAPLSSALDHPLYGVEGYLNRRAGDPVPVEMHLSPIVERGVTTGRVVVLHDIRERRNAEENRRLAAAVLEWSAQAILVADHRGNIVTVNPAFSRLSGFDVDTVIGSPVSILRSDHHDQGFHTTLRNTLERDGVWKGEIWNSRPDGSPYAVWLSITRITTRSDGGGFLVAFYFDITERKRHETMIIQAANHDALTGLPNRRKYEETLGDALAECNDHGRGLALFMIDLDGFKAVNDTHGHDAGDALLQEVSHRISRIIRSSDFAARLGGDEFVILLPDADRRAATRVAETLLRDLSAPIPYGQAVLSVSASIGIELHRPGIDQQSLVQAADQAMYTVKRSGKHGYLFAGQDSPGPDTPQVHEIQVDYIPIIDLQTLTACGVQARAQNAQDGLALFMDCQNTTDCAQSCRISPPTLSVRRHAIRALSEWHLLGLPHVTMALSMTHGDLSRCGCILHLWSMMSNASLDPRNVVIHVPLDSLLCDDEKILATIAQIRTLGYQLAVTNDPSLPVASPFNLPPDLRPDQVRISLRRLHHRQMDAAAILEGHLSLCQSIGATLLIQDLETPEDLTMALALNKVLAQGPILGHPMSAADIPRFIATFDPAKAWTT